MRRVILILLFIAAPFMCISVTSIPGHFAGIALTPAFADLPIGSNMPKLIGGPGDWINTGGKVLEPKKGSVYLVDF